MDLTDLFREEADLTPAKAMALIENLPMESKTAALLSGEDKSQGWSIDAYLTATLIDAVRENTFVNTQVRTKKRLKPPERFPIPGVRKEKRPNNFALMAQKMMVNKKE